MKPILPDSGEWTRARPGGCRASWSAPSALEGLGGLRHTFAGLGHSSGAGGDDLLGEVALGVEHLPGEVVDLVDNLLRVDRDGGRQLAERLLDRPVPGLDRGDAGVLALLDQLGVLLLNGGHEGFSLSVVRTLCLK